ncbi:MAG: hypothetical protein IKI77_08125 [Oscillospiraceae bacterium]|nr:hypothetical protein [Oscillospiraceae bacterium]
MQVVCAARLLALPIQALLRADGYDRLVTSFSFFVIKKSRLDAVRHKIACIKQKTDEGTGRLPHFLCSTAIFLQFSAPRAIMKQNIPQTEMFLQTPHAGHTKDTSVCYDTDKGGDGDALPDPAG